MIRNADVRVNMGCMDKELCPAALWQSPIEMKDRMNVLDWDKLSTC
jgi:hypothetical protein